MVLWKKGYWRNFLGFSCDGSTKCIGLDMQSSLREDLVSVEKYTKIWNMLMLSLRLDIDPPILGLFVWIRRHVIVCGRRQVFGLSCGNATAIFLQKECGQSYKQNAYTLQSYCDTWSQYSLSFLAHDIVIRGMLPTTIHWPHGCPKTKSIHLPLNCFVFYAPSSLVCNGISVIKFGL